MSQSAQQIQNRVFFVFNNKKFVLAVSFFLLLILAWVLGRFVTVFFEPIDAPGLPIESPAVTTVAQGKSSYLFGKPVKKAGQVKEKPKIKSSEIKRSRLNLTLVGVIDKGERSVALIQKSSKTLVVFEGDEFMPQVTLLEVFPEEVVINNSGVNERLSLMSRKNELLSNQVNKSNGIDKTTDTVIKEGLSQQDNEALMQIGSDLKRSPMAIAKFIRFKPINKNGQWSGVKIWPKSDKKLFKSIGFKEGDLLVNVNGRSIGELAKNPSLWQEFLKNSQFEMIVDRKGQEHSVSVDLSGN